MAARGGENWEEGVDESSPLVGNVWDYGEINEEGRVEQEREETWTSIRFGMYNICNGRNGGIELALRGMVQANLDLGLLHEMKLTDGFYARRSDGCRVVAMDGPRRHHGGVVVFYRASPWFSVQEMLFRFQLMTGERQ